MVNRSLLSMVTEIVSAHASANQLSQQELLSEIQSVYGLLSKLESGEAVTITATALVTEESEEAATDAPIVPAVPLAAAFAPDKVFCMVCGKSMKTLKRHISTAHALKPGQYRKMFGIPSGTSLTAKNYSDARKALAKTMDLGSRLEKARAARKPAKVKVAKPKAKRGRKPKAAAE